MRKIAFCFLIYDTINHEELWHHFFDNINKSKYSIYIHYKVDSGLKYFNQYKLNNCIETTYGDISIVKAQNILLSEALKDDNNEHFVFLSNSCIPLKNFDYVYEILNSKYSYFNLSPKEQCFPRCENLLKHVDIENIQKASQWCILNRKHSSIMVNENYIAWYETMFAPDEICYITNIYVNNLQTELITTPNLADGATTFTNWSDMDYKYISDCGLKNYNYITNEELLYLMNSKSLFGRKFLVECSLESEFYINKIKVN